CDGVRSFCDQSLVALARSANTMLYLAHTAHWQFFGLAVGSLAWIITMATVGLNEWRLWYVDDVPAVTSGVAWVGIWRACFYSHVLSEAEFCRSMGVADAFVPVEILVAQVLMMLSVICGLAANFVAAAAMRMAYFSVKDRRNIRRMFVLAGTLYLLTGALSLVPLAWNMNSVLVNRTIDFPPEFHLPAAPLTQQVGSAIAVGIIASILMLVSGIIFLSYRYVRRTLTSETQRHANKPTYRHWSLTSATADVNGRDNAAYFSDDVS
ncbi:claudin-34-like, partial [Solea senegalensis]